MPVPGRPMLDAQLHAALRAQVSAVAELTIASVAAEVPQYAGALDGEYRQALESGVRTAFAEFVDLLDAEPPDAVWDRVHRWGYVLGREEARAHRSVDALLAAYRVGTRVHWRELSRCALEFDVSARELADLAAFVIAYNHVLSAGSVAGHEDELAASGRLRERRLERLALAVISGEPVDALTARARRADWDPPQTLTAVLLPSDLHVRTVAAAFAGALTVAPGLADLPEAHDETVVLVRDAHDSRPALLQALRGTGAVVGPARPWLQAAVSYRRAVRSLALPRPGQRVPLDTEHHLTQVLLAADPEALADLRRSALVPLADLPHDTANRLALTLRSWLLHQGRREAVAADLGVHPQTVRYRMDQIRERYGTALQDPERVLELTIALTPPA